jgi:hypothetical protein
MYETDARLVQAQLRHREARQRLWRLFLAALEGYDDPEVVDRAARRVQQTKDRLQALRVTETSSHRRREVPVTSRRKLEFARWLVKTGRLSG